MARVTIVSYRSGTFSDGVPRGAPSAVAKIDTVNASFASAGNPDYVIPSGTEAAIFLTDTAIDFVVVRAGEAATVKVATPLPIGVSGISQYIMELADGDRDVFLREMA